MTRYGPMVTGLKAGRPPDALDRAIVGQGGGIVKWFFEACWRCGIRAQGGAAQLHEPERATGPRSRHRRTRRRACPACAATATWKKVGGSDQSIDLSKLTVASVSDSAEVTTGLDGTVMAHVTSSIASERQIEAATAYAKGDTTTASRLMKQNKDELALARAMAPAEEAAKLGSQSAAYDRGAQAFAAAAPTSTQGRAAAKSMVMFESKNLSKPAKY